MSASRVILFGGLQITRYLRYYARLCLKPSVIKLHGILFPIPENSNDEKRRSFYRERHERSLALMILAKLSRDDMVLEMGGGRGVLSTLCAKLIGSERVHTYEANPALIPFIKKIYALNSVEPTLTNAAVGVSNQPTAFHLGQRDDSSSLLETNSSENMITVPQVAANDIIAAVNPTFLIVDIEGAEQEVLGSANLEKVRVIVLEIHRKMLGESGCAALDNRITSFGFKVNKLYSTSGRKLYEKR
jgi:FkbM family methyltransferase